MIFDVLRLLPRLAFLDPIGNIGWRFSLLLQALLAWLEYNYNDDLSSIQKMEKRLDYKIMLKFGLNGGLKAPDVMLKLWNNFFVFSVVSEVLDKSVDLLKQILSS